MDILERETRQFSTTSGEPRPPLYVKSFAPSSSVYAQKIQHVYYFNYRYV